MRFRMLSATVSLDSVRIRADQLVLDSNSITNSKEGITNTMLAISRKQGEALLFPGLNIRIFIHEVCGRKVKLYIQAPGNVRILREELLADEVESLTSGKVEGSEADTPQPQTLSPLPAVPKSTNAMPPANPVQLWNRVQSRKVKPVEIEDSTNE